jgi:hypothetical protein
MTANSARWLFTNSPNTEQSNGEWRRDPLADQDGESMSGKIMK